MIDQSYKDCTRLLSHRDLDDIMSIVSVKSKITGVDIKKYDLDFFKESISQFLEPFPNTELGQVIGYFENGVLISFLTQQYTSRSPMWYMTMLATRSPHPWNYKMNGLEMCWANAMDRAESMGTYRILWSMPVAWANSQRRTIKTSDVWPRYEIYNEVVVKSNTLPQWPEHKNVFGKLVKDHDVLIKSASLKNEFRRININT